MENYLTNLLNDPRLIIIMLWSFVWKGIALWKAAQNNQKFWFIAILVINTVGVMEIIYLLFFLKKDRYFDQIIKKVKK